MEKPGERVLRPRSSHQPREDVLAKAYIIVFYRSPPEAASWQYRPCTREAAEFLRVACLLIMGRRSEKCTVSASTFSSMKFRDTNRLWVELRRLVSV
jgi:hypothetical protein